MTGIYIGSTTSRAGKSLLTFSLGVLLQKAGYTVGYIKPFGRIPQKKDELLGDADALVVQEILGQNAPADIVSPVMIPQNLHSLTVLEDTVKAGAMQRIQDAYGCISSGKDITLVSGTGAFPATGRFADADGLRVARALGLSVLLIERYARGVNYDRLLLLKDLLGPALLGIVINDVPDEDMRDTAKLLVPWLLQQGIVVHGLIKREPELSAMRVAELAQGLRGRVVAGNVHAARMVQGFLIGTMQVDNFMMHLRQRSACAVIVGGDRLDLQLAAMHSDTPCIILTGNITPSELIRSRAEAKGTALIVVREDTYTIARSMSRILKSKKLRDLNQIRLAVNLVKNSLNYDPILDKLSN